MKIIQKKIGELTRSESEQLEALIYRYYRAAKPKFISDRLEKDYGYDIVMLKKGDIIQGASFYHLLKYDKGTWKRPAYILHFSIAMKRSGYKGNLIWTLGRWYARRNIGRSYLFQNVTGISTVISPKVFENFTHLFPTYYANTETAFGECLHQFTANYFNQTRGMNMELDEQFCFDSFDLEQEDITEDWDRVYRAKDDSFNQLFIDNGIIKMEGDRIYKMPKHIVVCGLRRPLAFGKSMTLPHRYSMSS